MSTSYTPINNFTYGRFQGNDSVSIGSKIGVALNGTAAFSVDTWVKFDGLCDDGTIFSQDDVFSLGIFERNIVATINGYPPVSSSAGSVKLNTDDWFYITMTFNLTEVILYINGYLVAQQIIQGSPSGTPGTVKVGDKLQGRIRRVIVYNQALSAPIILANMYNAPASGTYCAWIDLTTNPPADKSINHWPLIPNYTPTQEIPSVVMSDTGYAKPVQYDKNINPGGSGNDSYTIMATISSAILASKQVIFLNADSDGTTGISLWLDKNADAINLNLKATHGALDGTSDTIVSIKTLDTDTWYSVAVTYDKNKNLKLYINGAAGTSGSVTTPVTISPNVMMIGCAIKDQRPTGAYSFMGHIQNLSIWSKALSATSHGEITHFALSASIGAERRTSPSVLMVVNPMNGLIRGRNRVR